MAKKADDPFNRGREVYDEFVRQPREFVVAEVKLAIREGPDFPAPAEEIRHAAWLPPFFGCMCRSVLRDQCHRRATATFVPKIASSVAVELGWHDS